MAGARASIERAWSARTAVTRAKHARAAIAADPDALDAYVLLGQTRPAVEALPIYAEGVRRGRAIWAAAMKAPARHGFWGDHDTRPFMRVMHLYALALWDSGDHAAAIAEARTLLRLNRNDNQGIRELLAVWYPVTGAWGDLDKLLARYPDDWSTSHAYTCWLVAFRKGEVTAAALATALDVNPHVPLFLADPAATPVIDGDDAKFAAMGYVTMGSADEAHGYADFARSAWDAVPGAIARLVQDAATPPQPT